MQFLRAARTFARAAPPRFECFRRRPDLRSLEGHYPNFDHNRASGGFVRAAVGLHDLVRCDEDRTTSSLDGLDLRCDDQSRQGAQESRFFCAAGVVSLLSASAASSVGSEEPRPKHKPERYDAPAALRRARSAAEADIRLAKDLMYGTSLAALVAKRRPFWASVIDSPAEVRPSPIIHRRMNRPPPNPGSSTRI